MNGEEYLTIHEVANLLKVKPKTIRNKMASGVFRVNVHYFSPRGLRPRFKWSAVQEWLEGKDKELGEFGDIRMSRGYTLGSPLTDTPMEFISDGTDGLQGKKKSPR